MRHAAGPWVGASVRGLDTRGERQRAHALRSSQFILSFLILCHHVLQTGNRKKMVGKGGPEEADRKINGQTKVDPLAKDLSFLSRSRSGWLRPGSGMHDAVVLRIGSRLPLALVPCPKGGRLPGLPWTCLQDGPRLWGGRWQVWGLSKAALGTSPGPNPALHCWSPSS